MPPRVDKGNFSRNQHVLLTLRQPDYPAESGWIRD